MGANSRNAMFTVINAFGNMDIFSCSELNIFDPNATEANVFRFDCIFSKGLSSIMRAHRALLMLASALRTLASLEWFVSVPNPNHHSAVFLTVSNVSFNCDARLFSTSVLSNL